MPDNITNLNLESFYGGRPGNSLQIVKAYDCIKSTEGQLWKNKYYAQRHNDHGILAFIYTNNGLIERTFTNGNSYENWGAIPQDGNSHTIQVYSSNDEPKDDWDPGVVSSLIIDTERIPRVSMEDEFKAGDATTSIVNYGEYVIIDNEEDDFERGKIFKRGYNSSADLGGAEYVATICGPRGPKQYKGIYFLGQVSSKNDLYSGNVPIPPEEIGQETGNKDLDHKGWCMAVYNSTTNPPQYDIYCYDYYWNKAGSGKTYEDAWFCIGSIDEAALDYKYLSKQEAESTYAKIGGSTFKSIQVGDKTKIEDVSYGLVTIDEKGIIKREQWNGTTYDDKVELKLNVKEEENYYKIAKANGQYCVHTLPGITVPFGVDPLITQHQLRTELSHYSTTEVTDAKYQPIDTFEKNTYFVLDFSEGSRIYLCSLCADYDPTASGYYNCYSFLIAWVKGDPETPTEESYTVNFLIGDKTDFEEYAQITPNPGSKTIVVSTLVPFAL
jgi:hypothetical protein